MATEINGSDIKKEAFRLCQDFLGAPWTEISISDFNISTVSGGITNALYCCSLTNNVVVPHPKIPRKVLLRIYGPLQDEEHGKVIQTTTFVLLAEKKLGPKLYGVFPNGRLEEYIPSKHLSVGEIRKFSTSVARAMAKIHALSLPVRKAPDSWLNYMKKWLQDIEIYRAQTFNESFPLGDMFRKEMKFLRKEMENYDSPSVFCHNDLTGGNILLPDDCANRDDPNLILIDFEFGGYNYRSFDIANHFCEWASDYDVAEPPFFKLDTTKYPTKEEKIQFIRAYLNQLVEEGIIDASAVETEVDKILKEIKFFRMAAQLYWALWSEKTKYEEVIGIFHEENGKVRQALYWKLKEIYLRQKVKECNGENGYPE